MSSLKLKHSGGNSMSIEAPATNPASNLALKLPATIGSANQILKNSGTAGTLGWSSIIENSDGDLGIGTTSPSHKLHVVSSDTDTAFFKGRIVRVDGAASSDSPRLNFSLDGTDKTSLMCNRTDNALWLETSTTASMIFRTDSTTRVDLNANGRWMHYSGDNTMIQSSIAGAVRMQLYHTGGGDVTWSNPSSGSATYSTSSDYRLKQDVVDLPNAWSTVKALKPYEYKWKHNTSKTSQGFFAHEVIATVPNSQAGQGTKDAVDSENKPIYQQIDYSKLVPLLTKALQEAITEIETLKTKVAALEAG